MGPYDPIPPPDPEAIAGARALRSVLNDYFAPLVSEFDELYDAWKATWYSGRMALSSNSHDRADGEEYEALIELGLSIIPLVVEKLTLPTDFTAVHLYNFLEENQQVKVNPDNILDYMVMQRHANLIVDMNNDRNKQFQTRVRDWKKHQEENQFSSNSSAYVSGPAYKSLVAMGLSVIPNIMVLYAAEQDGWWHELLHEIVFGKRAGPGAFPKSRLYANWKAWFVSGGLLSEAPQGL